MEHAGGHSTAAVAVLTALLVTVAGLGLAVDRADAGIGNGTPATVGGDDPAVTAVDAGDAHALAVDPNSTARLTGEVLFEDGTPADNVTIDVVNTSTGEVAIDNVTTRGFDTAAPGTWGPLTVPPGNYTAVLSPEGKLAEQCETFSTLVSVEVGETRRIETTITGAPAAADLEVEDVEGFVGETLTFTVTVYDQVGDPLPNADVAIVGREGSPAPTVVDNGTKTTDTTGTVEFSVTSDRIATVSFEFAVDGRRVDTSDDGEVVTDAGGASVAIADQGGDGERVTVTAYDLGDDGERVSVWALEDGAPGRLLGVLDSNVTVGERVEIALDDPLAENATVVAAVHRGAPDTTDTILVRDRARYTVTDDADGSTGLAGQYDADGDGAVDEREVLAVVGGYNAGAVDDPGVVLAVIAAYNAGAGWDDVDVPGATG